MNIFYFEHCKFPSHIRTGHDSAAKQGHSISNSKINNELKLKLWSLWNDIFYFNITVALKTYYFIEKYKFRVSIVTTKIFPSNFKHHDRENKTVASKLIKSYRFRTVHELKWLEEDNGLEKNNKKVKYTLFLQIMFKKNVHIINDSTRQR